MSAPLELRGVAAGYGGEPVLRGLDFALEAGMSLCVLGPNGGGKTTLFRLLVGELAPAAGELRIDERPAYMAQSERARLDFPVSAHDVALMGSLPRGRTWLPPRASEREAAARALERVGLTGQADTRFGALSGGERQRTLLARALVQESRLLLLDEPLASVDPGSARSIEALLAELRREGRTVVVTTHDVRSARRFDRVLCLNRRQVVFGRPADVLDRPTLEATYGEELIVLGEHDPTSAVTVQHHEH